MSATGLAVFDRTLHITHIWLDELMRQIGPDRHVAWHVLGVVLRTVRDRIPLELAVHLGSQLPLLVRGAYYDRWRSPGRIEDKPRSLEEFLEPIRQELAQIRPVNAREATRAVFQILSRHVSSGQVEKVKNALPGHIRALWPDVSELPGLPEEPERSRLGGGGRWRPGTGRYRSAGIGIGAGALVAAGFAAAALAAFRVSGRRSWLVWNRGGKRIEDRSYSGGHIQDHADRNRRRGGGRSHESLSPSGWDHDNAGGYDDQGRGRRMIGSGYGGPETERDYRGGGYGSAYMPGGYDPDNDYRVGIGGPRSGFGEGLAYGRGYGGAQTGEHRGRGPKGYQRSDARIVEDACERLTEDPHIDASDIDVAVVNGEVTLTGSIKSRIVKRYVEDLVEGVSGVRHIQNNLRIQPRASVLMGAGRTTGAGGGQTGGENTPTIG